MLRNRAATNAARVASLPKDIAAWLHIGEDGSVTVYTGKVEMGQNIRTSLTQAVAEELHVPVSKDSDGDGRYPTHSLRSRNFRQSHHSGNEFAVAQSGVGRSRYFDWFGCSSMADRPEASQRGRRKDYGLREQAHASSTRRW